ncbi:hypothetical protein pb186bvf_010328 [Paramecium bursaria]
MGCTCSSKKETQKEKFEDLPQINVNKVNKSKRIGKNEQNGERDKTNTTQKSPQSLKKQFLQPDDEYLDSLKHLSPKKKLENHPQTLPQFSQIPLQITDQKPQSENFFEKPQLESKSSRRDHLQNYIIEILNLTFIIYHQNLHLFY